jgi:hypothetical protein
MEISFPSKLTDCTAVGLPLLIYGPPYCSASRWARENPGVAELVEAEGEAELRRALHRLVTSSDHRISLSKRALEVGHRFFAHAVAQQIFYSALLHESSPATEQTSGAVATQLA